MSEEQKAPYQKKHEIDKVRYEKQCKELEKKGYYTLSDGSKTTDPQNSHMLKVKKKRAKTPNKEVEASSDSDGLDVEETPAKKP